MRSQMLHDVNVFNYYEGVLSENTGLRSIDAAWKNLSTVCRCLIYLKGFGISVALEKV